ncbi:glutathione S-transferase N-terminal domain-containing protein [bacterium]|nr:glutathione S-transferase N-terminal domain-containing protein [bacterium]
MILNVIRKSLGYSIVFLNFIFKPKRIQRPANDQQKVDQATSHLSLYQFYLCPFCVRVRRHIDRLNLKIEYRDAKNNETHRQDLLSGGGRIKVPCLRIEENKNVTWLYESKVINAYLEKRFSLQPNS